MLKIPYIERCIVAGQTPPGAAAAYKLWAKTPGNRIVVDGVLHEIGSVVVRCRPLRASHLGRWGAIASWWPTQF